MSGGGRPGRKRSSPSKRGTRSRCSRADMGIRQFKPVTPATRFRSVSDFGDITKTEPERSLLEPLRRTGGRNNKGHITSRYRVTGHKRQYRRIAFRRDTLAVTAKLPSIQ